MRTHQYKRKNESNGATYTFYELDKAVRVLRELNGHVFEHIFTVGDFVQGRTLKEFGFDQAISEGHSVYVTSEEYNSSNAQSLAAQIDIIYANKIEQETELESDISSIISDFTIGKTEKESLIKSRVGQGAFRKKLLDMWGGCSITGCTTYELLVASHSKPWKISNDDERLDPYNGFLLVAHLDKAFDSGLISFDCSGQILISETFKEHELIGITTNMKVALKPKHKIYLKYHRKNIFKDT